MALSEEDKKKIEEEEKHRGKVRSNLRVKRFGIGCLGCLGLVVVLVVFGVIGTSLQDESEQTTQQEQLEGGQEVTYGVGDDVKVGDVRWKLLSAKDRGSVLKASESRYPSIADAKKTPGKFIQIEIELENLSNDLLTVIEPELIDDRGREFTAATDVSEWIPEDRELYILDNLNPNIPTRFIIIYEVPSDAKGLKVKVGDLDIFASGEALIELGF